MDNLLLSIIKPTAPPYRTRAGLWHNRQIFFEQWIALKVEDRVVEPVFTLYKDRPGLVNARTTFIDIGDPTGYEWAITYLGDYNHWKYLMKSPWFQEAYETWLEELTQKQLAAAIKVITEIALSGDSKAALPAARYLAEQGWKKPDRGRPTKATIDANLKQAMRERSIEDDDAERIGLTVISGGKAAQN